MKKETALARVRSFFASLFVDRKGASGVEYAIVAAIILAAVGTAAGTLSGKIDGVFEKAGKAMSGK